MQWRKRCVSRRVSIVYGILVKAQMVSNNCFWEVQVESCLHDSEELYLFYNFDTWHAPLVIVFETRFHLDKCTFREAHFISLSWYSKPLFVLKRCQVVLKYRRVIDQPLDKERLRKVLQKACCIYDHGWIKDLGVRVARYVEESL